MDKTRIDDEARNIKDATVVDPEVNVCCVRVYVFVDAPMTLRHITCLLMNLLIIFIIYVASTIFSGKFRHFVYE